MTERKSDELGPLLTELGHQIAAVVDRNPDNALLFGDVGDGYVGGAIFLDEGNEVRWFELSDTIHDLLENIWQSDNADRKPRDRWIYIEYDVRDGKFNASFGYREDVARGSFSTDWEDAAVKKRFGDKPVVYPPTPDWILEIQERERLNPKPAPAEIETKSAQRVDPNGGDRINGRVTLGVDTATIMIFHPDDLAHAADRLIGWYGEPEFYPEESEAGRLIAWSTGSDGVYDVRLTDTGPSERERQFAGPHWDFPITVRHGRLYVDNADAIPGWHQFENPFENETNWIDVPNGEYRVTVTGIDWSMEDGVADDGSDGLPDYVVHFAPASGAVEPAKRPPSIRPFKNEVADDTVFD